MLLDTSGLLTLLFDGEAEHARAVELFEPPVPKWVTELVMAELVALAQARKYPREAVLGFLRDLVAHPSINVYYTDALMFDRAISLLESRPDKGYSLCDAVSILVMRDHGVSEALTTDRHFVQEGFRKLLGS